MQRHVHRSPAGQVCSLLQSGVPLLRCSGVRALGPPALPVVLVTVASES